MRRKRKYEMAHFILIDYYTDRINFYIKQRKGKGITQTDMSKAQKDVKEYMKGIVSQRIL